MNSEIQEALQYCPTLPTPPSIAMRIVEMGRDPEVNIADLAGLLARDPALASRVLRVSNSPMYAQRRRSDNLRQAVMVLGLNATMTLALSFSLGESLRADKSEKRIIGVIWRRALISAMTSRMLGERLGAPSAEDHFLAALLQDLGVLALQAALPERYEPMLARVADHDALLLLERETLGTDHGEAGAWLMRHWGLPEYLAVTATACHAPQTAELPTSIRPIALSVNVAGCIADLLLGDDRPAQTEKVAVAAGEWLGMDQPAMDAVLEGVAEGLPQVERLFDTKLISARKAAGVIDEARELLMARNLHLIQQASEQQRKRVELEQTTQELRESAGRDALTGVLNRRDFDDRMAREFALSTEHRWPLSVGFLDLDHFKPINDRHGHQIGDAVLAALAKTLEAELRERDIIVRYGGEEFVILLPGTGVDAATQVFDRLRVAVEQQTHKGEHGETFQVTASIGVATHMDGERRHTDASQLLRSADRALYDAKRMGRNRVQVAA